MSSFSKLAKKPILIPEGVRLKVVNNVVIAEYGSVSRSLEVSSDVILEIIDGTCKVDAARKVKNCAMIGTFVAKLKNLLRDIKNPYKVCLVLIGVGYKAFKVDGDIIALSIGYSHLVAFQIPDGIMYNIKDNTEIELSGFVDDVTAFADDVCKSSPWDPCLQSGIVIKGSFLRRKEGKKK
ncbi:MAG: hypothetical protein JJW01_02030 [Alphaproteobacteria bacterium]|nr:hypothetical protein [Rickettsiales bacterium]